MNDWLTRVAAAARRNPRTAGFFVTAALLSVAALREKHTAQYGDAAGYWWLAKTFETSDGFSFSNYYAYLRTYSVPFFVYLIQKAAAGLSIPDMVFFRVVSAFLGAAVLAVALPTLFGRVFAVRLTLSPVLAFCLLGFIYWRGHLLQPLSDFPALLALAVGLLYLPTDLPGRWGAAAALAGGICLGLAANARPINESALWSSGLLVCWHLWRTRTAAVRVAALAFVGGVTLSVLPQAFVNQRIYRTSNPFAHSSAEARLPSLYLQQLAWGVAIQKYETNVGGGGFPISIIFADVAGQDLSGFDRARDPRDLAQEPALRKYLEMVVRHPLFFARAYLRHLFNGLDVAYPDLYLERVAPRSALLAAANFAMICVAITWCIRRWRTIQFRGAEWRVALAATFLLPALLAIPTAVEPRFLLPAWTLIYGFVIFRLGRREVFELLRSPSNLLIAAAAVAGCFTLASATYSHIQGAPASYSTWSWW
ncbi:MAG: hypothetical protein U0Q16_08460 [Bryobacteraceae bacterium]